MSRRAGVVLLAVVVAGVAALVVVGARDERDFAFTLGVAPAGIAALLAPGEEACQWPVEAVERFDGVRTPVGTNRRPGPAVAVTVRRGPARETLARGRIAGGYPDFEDQRFALDRAVEPGQSVAVCMRNVGRRDIALFGQPDEAKSDTAATVDGRDAGTDMALVFTRPSRSVLAAVPDAFERAALFRPAWVGAWTWWSLLALALAVVPALLALALRGAFAEADADR
jgi:hypothetical protein